MARQETSYKRPAVRTIAPRVIDPVRAAGLQELGETYLAAANPEAAVAVLSRAAVLNPLEVGIRIALARAWYQTGALETALEWLAGFAGQGHARLELLRGQVLYDLRRFPDANQAFSLALQADRDLNEARIHRAATMLAMANPSAAVSDLDEVLKREPGNTEALMLRASAQLESGDSESALTDLGAIPEHARTPEHVLLLARASLLSGRRESEVEECFADGLKRFPQDFRLRLAFGRYLASRRGLDPSAARRAVSALESLVESEDPQAPLPRIQAEALFLLGELAAETAEMLSQAESYFHRGLALLPDDPRGLTGIGALMVGQGRPAHGLPWLLQSILIDPERPQTLEYLAKALTAVPDDEAVARWIGLVTAGLPGHSPTLLTHLLRFVQEAGRADAYEEVRREGHRMKNLVAVLASRLGPDLDPAKVKELDKLYREWAAFLERIRLPSPSPSLLSVNNVVRQALQQAVGDVDYMRCRLPADLPQVRGEEAGLVDALANILRNAVEAFGDSPPSRNSIRLAVRHRQGSRWLEIIVTDEGHGIELEDQKHIFDPGFSRREGGSGLGLAIAQRVVMAHGGRISVASAPGGPTTFVVRLPVATRSTPEQLLRYQTRTFHASSGRGYRRPEAATKESDHAGQGHAG